ncbi:MAG: TetR/AcrR family transcriptional regulator [Thermoanaerobaculia bacterium]|jgi:TetR/AcrR family transcriptional repressor of nem operon
MPWEKQFDVNEVLDKAMQVFWHRGYGATSVQDLVKETGINRGSLYATYRDKHALFLASLRMYADNLRHERLAQLEARFAPKEAIHQLLLAFADLATEKGGNKGCFLTNTALELAAHDPVAAKVVAKAQKDMEAFFARMIEQGQASGEIPESLKPAATASGLLATLIGLAVLCRSRPERNLLQSIVADAMRRLV